MTSSILHTALSGLRASQRQLDLVSHNLANVSTPGYGRRTLAQSSVAVAGMGAGVDTGPIIRVDGGALATQYRGTTTAWAAAETRDRHRASVEQLFGKPSTGKAAVGVLGEALARLKKDIDGLAANVGSVPPSLVVGSARALATQLNTMSRQIQDQRLQADQAIAGHVRALNGLAGKVAALNGEVTAGRATGIDTADLEDRRDRLINQMAELTGVSHHARPDGSMVVMTREGRTLVDGPTARTLGMADGAGKLVDYAPVTAMTATTPTQRIGIGTPGAAAGPDLTAELLRGGGRIGALLEQRGQYSAGAALPQGELQQRTAELNQFVLGLFNTMRAANLATTDIAGNPAHDPANGVNEANGMFAGIYPSPPASPGNIDNAATIQIHPDLMANPDLLQKTAGAMDVRIAKSLAAAIGSKSVSFASAGALGAVATGLSGYLDTIVGNVAATRATGTDELRHQAGLRSSLEGRLGQATGVNLDEELAKLMSYQKSYQASAKMIQAANSMLDIVLDLVRAR